MEQFRVIAESRVRPRCTCCTFKEAEAMEHAWGPWESGVVNRLKDAEQVEIGLLEETNDRQGLHEYREITIQVATLNWTDA